MVVAKAPIQFEGKWEDIVQRGSELAGQRVRVTVLPKESAASSLDQILAPMIAEAKLILKDPNPSAPKGLSSEYSEAVAEQLRKQGLKA